MPPTVTPHASATTVSVGQLVNFSTTASDTLSGVSGQYNWTFGDNTGSATGATPAHTYTQAGVYQATVATTDGAGNQGHGNIAITVNPASQPGAPGNTGSPTITGTTTVGHTLAATTTVGHTLAATTGSWSGSPTSFAYQRQLCDETGANCSNISGATANTHLLTATEAGHTLRIVVKATNAKGTGQGSSEQTAVIAPPSAGLPSNTALPVISGTATPGQTLRSTTGSWTGSPTSYVYQWQSCDAAGANCANIAGATGNSRLLGTTDVGHTLRLVVTATNSAGSTPANSDHTAVVSTGTQPGGPPHLSGEIPGSTFHANQGVMLKLTLSNQATIVVQVAKLLSGRKVKNTCRANAKKGKRCTSYVSKTRLTIKGIAGPNHIKLNTRTYAPGRYRATITARDSTGRTSKTLTFTFTIKR